MVKIVDWISNAFAVLSMVILIFIMLFITVSVCGRYFLGVSIPDDIIIMQALLVVMVFLPFAYVQRKGEHLSVSILTDHLPAKGQYICQLIGLFVGISFMAIVMVASFGDAYTAYVDEAIFEGPLEIKEWPSRGSVFVGTGLLLIKLVLDFITAILHGPMADEISSPAEY
ncbi:TRAP transporter small permease [Sneathiella marina]|uniref:TRAP transporter small permease protein n=1 Tax=Sneathiella marina TaxID=2950108 RepID=A0ABY4WBG6_9PROT|nr:TRAP transporter small permease [Sneathiella marina]USG63115.1 TRAP transporter small permease [Sneathiella marina]